MFCAKSGRKELVWVAGRPDKAELELSPEGWRGSGETRDAGLCTGTGRT